MQRKWARKDVTSVQPEWTGTKPDFLRKDMTPCYIFDCFWDDEVIEHTEHVETVCCSEGQGKLRGNIS